MMPSVRLNIWRNQVINDSVKKRNGEYVCLSLKGALLRHIFVPFM